MVAAAETAPIERIPLQKDGGAENDRRSKRAHSHPALHSRTIAPPLHSPHGSPTAALPPKK